VAYSPVGAGGRVWRRDLAGSQSGFAFWNPRPARWLFPGTAQGASLARAQQSHLTVANYPASPTMGRCPPSAHGPMADGPVWTRAGCTGGEMERHQQCSPRRQPRSSFRAVTESAVGSAPRYAQEGVLAAFNEHADPYVGRRALPANRPMAKQERSEIMSVAYPAPRGVPSSTPYAMGIMAFPVARRYGNCSSSTGGSRKAAEPTSRPAIIVHSAAAASEDR
jgi:hypothetical protein